MSEELTFNDDELIPNDESLSVSQDDIDSINIDSLTDAMVRGIYTLEAALFSQASHEGARITKLRGFINSMESKLFDPETLSTLNNKQLLSLYAMSQNALSDSMDFLYNLHRSLTTGMEAISTISKHKNSIAQKTADNKSSDIDSVKREIGDLILAKIKERTTEQK